MIKQTALAFLSLALPSFGLDQTKAASYLNAISGLEPGQAFELAATFSIPGNPTSHLHSRILETRQILLSQIEGGMGKNHPERISMFQQFRFLLKQRQHSLVKTKRLLRLVSEGKPVPDTQKKVESLQELRHYLRKSGLGANHPDVKILTLALQQEID